MTEVTSAQLQQLIQHPQSVGSVGSHASQSQSQTPQTFQTINSNVNRHIDTPRAPTGILSPSETTHASMRSTPGAMDLYRQQRMTVQATTMPPPAPRTPVHNAGLQSASVTRMREYTRRMRQVSSALHESTLPISGSSVSEDPLMRSRVEQTHQPPPPTATAKPSGWRRNVLLGVWDRLRTSAASPPIPPNPVMQWELQSELTNIVVRVGATCFGLNANDLRNSPGLQALVKQQADRWVDMPDWIKLSGTLALRKAVGWIFPPPAPNNPDYTPLQPIDVTSLMTTTRELPSLSPTQEEEQAIVKEEESKSTQDPSTLPFEGEITIEVVPSSNKRKHEGKKQEHIAESVSSAPPSKKVKRSEKQSTTKQTSVTDPTGPDTIVPSLDLEVVRSVHDVAAEDTATKSKKPSKPRTPRTPKEPKASTAASSKKSKVSQINDKINLPELIPDSAPLHLHPVQIKAENDVVAESPLTSVIDLS